ncbi:MAG TPA: TetR family transcriptional regulator [Solirubrobacteraceae bacterium]|jgi:AcrR family transcriptional regulator|nr:TetR family transcriptional regulator [Solirubrobacteraceae bacterium]
MNQGLRERKKQQTRDRIRSVARELFIERGFERVTVAEVALAADVSEATAFNYFPTKEDLFFGGLEEFEEQLLDAIRLRDPGETVLTAFGRFVLTPRGLLATKDPESVERLASITRVIEASPALLAREQQIFSRFTDSLAALLAAESGAPADAIEPWVLANALMGVHRALVSYTRSRILAGARSTKLSRDVRAQGRAALAALERGLGGGP